MLPAAEVAVAARLLGPGVRLREVLELRPGQVARFAVDGEGTVIVKRAGTPEVAALQHLAAVVPGVAPRILGVDPAAGVVVLEDLGVGGSLADALLGADAAVATEAAVAYAHALGRLHSATVGHAAELPTGEDRHVLRGLDVRAGIDGLPGALAHAGLPPLDRAALDGVVDELGAPGPFLAFSTGDPCPDNLKLDAGMVQFFDLEVAGYRHALLDAAYLRLPFPNCWCWRRLPPAVVGAMEATYRVASAVAVEDGRYAEASARTTAAWVVWTLHHRLPHIAADAGALERTVATLERVGADRHLPAFAAWCRSAVDVLRAREPGLPAEPALYPAFGGPPWPEEGRVGV